MLVNIWPDVSLRSETFTADPSDGVVFRSTVGGVSAAGLQYKWKIDSGTANNQNGGELVTSGNATDFDTGGQTLEDLNNNFEQAGDNGVREGDLVLNVTDGSSGNVFSVDDPNHLTVSSPADLNIGLTGGGGVVRNGTATNGAASATQLDDAGYDFVGATNGPAEGGIIPGDIVTNLSDGSTATVVTVVVGTMTTSALAGGLDNLWEAGDQWQVVIPANQWRIGFEYEIYSFDGFISKSSADADYATEDAIIDFHLDLNYPFDLNAASNNPSIVQADWNNDGVFDESFAVGDTTRLDGAINSLEVERVRIRHDFAPGEYPVAGGPTAARYRVITTPLGQTAPNTYGPFLLPVVIIGRDDFDQDLRTLNLNSQSWDNTDPHRVTLEVGFTQSTILTENPIGGTTNFLYRTFHASDTLSVPAGTQDRANSLSTWVSYSTPFVFNNSTGSTNMRHQAVNGIGAALNWVSDANADGRWDPASFALSPESPLANNPVNYHEFVFQNGANMMNVPGGNMIKGGSFPVALPGVGADSIGGGFAFFQANRGVYNGMGFAADNLDVTERAFSFDSQAIFLGDRISSGSNESRPLAADVYIEPLVSSNTQFIELQSYVSGGTAPYTYQWQVQKTSGAYVGPVGVDKVFNGNSSNISSPLFIPFEDVSDEGGPVDDGSGDYQVFLDVFDSAGGSYRTAYRVITVTTPPLSVNVMANPPSGSVGDQIEFNIFVDGGQPDYLVDIDFESDGLNAAQGDLIGFTLSDGSHELFANYLYSESGSYVVTVNVTDGAGGNSSAQTTVDIAETIPLNANLLVTPASGVAPFLVNVHYSVSGGRELAGNDDYNIIIELISLDGTAQPAVSRTESNSFGPNGVLDDPRLPGSDDEPATFVVPAPGNYYVQLIATDNGGAVKTARDDVFASGYLLPTEYGDDRPQITRDLEGRPMHAVRVWQDPYLNIDSGGNTNWNNVMDGELGGGRLLEGDIQVIGDVIGVDPNQSFRSAGNFATPDPLDQPLYYANYSLATQGEELVQDYYDTFSVGRVNLNTASEQVLTALFRKIKSTRGYDYDQDIDMDGDGSTENYRVVRDATEDVYLTEDQARTLARQVIEYRTAFYDAHKPTAPDTSGSFGYERSSYAGAYPELDGSFRVDHLPVIGPWDGVNPHEYSITDRNAELQDPDDDVNNSWDHMAASYYNIDPDAFTFYSPSDTAVVRERWTGDLTIALPGGITFSQPSGEPLSNYAKYLNDVAANDFWYINRGPFFADWATTGLYQDSTGYYSRWAFDARNYFTYPGGEFDIAVDAATDPGNPTVTVTPVPGSLGEPADARNMVGIIDSNGETVYAYIPNPPFRNIFDLFKVINTDQAPAPFRLIDSGGFSEIELVSGGSEDRLSVTNEVFSGPSVFRYVARWDDLRGEYIPIANYLDDIAPYVTCRSFVFRVEGAGAVTASGGGTGAYLDTAKISRDRSKTAVIDLGPLNARRTGTPALTDGQRSQGLTVPAGQRNYQILYWNEQRE